MRPALKKLESGDIALIGYQRVIFHMIFYVKMEDYRRKARLVAGGHVTEPPDTITYASVVLRDKLRIALTLNALNYLPVKVADIQNAYIAAPDTEKIWTVLGQEFGGDAGSKAIVLWSVYGMKSSGYDVRNHLVDCMHHLGILPCPADLELWMKPIVRSKDGFEYYTYVIKYVDNVMVIHHDTESVIRRIDKYFKLNPSSIGDPEIYLGAKLKKMRLENRVWEWANSPASYVKESVANVEKYLAELADAR